MVQQYFTFQLHTTEIKLQLFPTEIKLSILECKYKCMFYFTNFSHYNVLANCV